MKIFKLKRLRSQQSWLSFSNKSLRQEHNLSKFKRIERVLLKMKTRTRKSRMMIAQVEFVLVNSTICSLYRFGRSPRRKCQNSPDKPLLRSKSTRNLLPVTSLNFGITTLMISLKPLTSKRPQKKEIDLRTKTLAAVVFKRKEEPIDNSSRRDQLLKLQPLSRKGLTLHLKFQSSNSSPMFK